MKARYLISAVVLSGFGSLLTPGSALAGDGVVLSPTVLSVKQRTSLEEQVARARAANPDVFASFARLRADLPSLDARKRGRFVPVSKLLRGFGRDGLMPMLEELALDAPGRGSMSDSAWQAWRTGLIEAVGSLRDPRSAPVLLAVLEGPETDFMLLRAASAAYGKLGTDRVAGDLIRISRASSAKRQAVLAGMGHCRRLVIAAELAEVMAHRPDPRTAEHLVRSLGDLGSAWAWQTPSLASNREGPAVRAVAAQALVNAFVNYDDRVRKTAIDALLVVDDPSTPRLVAAARADAPNDLLPALDELERRFARNPIR